jgi:hypothetical protein
MQLGAAESLGRGAADAGLAETEPAAPECSWLKSWAKLEDRAAAGRTEERPGPSDIVMGVEAMVLEEWWLNRLAGLAFMAGLLSGEVAVSSEHDRSRKLSRGHAIVVAAAWAGMKLRRRA